MTDELDTHFASYERARREISVIAREGPGRWIVQMGDSNHGHVVRLRNDDGSIRGDCTCPRNDKGGETCTHLWAAYLAHASGVIEITTPAEAIESDLCPTCKGEVNRDAR